MATYAQQQAENLLKYYQGLGGTMREPSALASPEERRAFQAQEVRAGRAPMEMLPEQYGGRPTGTSRRAIRMAAAYDEAQRQALEQQRITQQIEQARFAEQRDAFRFSKEQNEYAAKQKLDALNERDAAQESAEVNAIASGLNSIDFKNDPEAGLKIDQLILNNPLGAIRKDVAERIEAARNIISTYGVAATTKAEQEDAEVQAQIQADIVKYNLTPEQQAKMLVPNLPAGVVRYDPNKAKPIIAEAEKAIEGREETKAQEKESEKRFDDYNKALAAYEGMVGDTQAEPEDVAKARAAVRGAAAVLRIPKVTSEEDLQNYQSGDKVLAPDGITIITVP